MAGPLYCTECGATYRDGKATTCVVCGGLLTSSPLAPPTDSQIALNLPVTVFACDSCGKNFVYDPNDKLCPHCGRDEASSDPLIDERVDAWGERIDEMVGRIRQWSPDNLAFARRGRRADAPEHFNLLSDFTLSRTLQEVDEFRSTLEPVEWKGDNPAAEIALNQLIELCTSMLFRLAAVVTTPPPLILVGVHRQGARVLARTLTALSPFLATLTAPSLDEAKRLGNVAQTALDEAGKDARLMSQFTDAVERDLELTSGWWSHEGNYDVGSAAWQAVGAAQSTVTEAASRVRAALGSIPGISSLSDPEAAQLVPVVGAGSYDPVRFLQKATAARTFLDAADQRTSWIADEAEFVKRIWKGHAQLVEQQVQLGYLLQSDPPRNVLLNSAMDTYSKLLEGPLRHFGSAIRVAARVAAGKQVVYDVVSIEDISPAKVLNYFLQKEPDLVEGALTLLRNAEAHYGFEISDDGITFRDVATVSGVRRERTDFLTDDDFFEELAVLTESLVAMEVALMPFIWTHTSSGIRQTWQALEAEPNNMVAGIRAVAGLRGFVRLTISLTGSEIAIDCDYLGSSSDLRLEFAPVAAAIFGSFSQSQVVRVQLRTGYRHSLQWSRTEVESLRRGRPS